MTFLNLALICIGIFVATVAISGYAHAKMRRKLAEISDLEDGDGRLGSMATRAYRYEISASIFLRLSQAAFCLGLLFFLFSIFW